MATAMEIVSDDAKDPVVSIAVLIDELRNDEPQIRLNSVRKLGDIARALGPDRTREELIPYLNEFIDDEDDILLALAEELGKLIDLVGGKELSHCLLVPLETLCSVEESVVRDKAVQSITSIIEVLPAEQVHKYVVPLIKALAGGEWYTIRISAAALVPVAYVRVDDETKKVFRALFAALCRDETPMTRRAAATHFGTLAKSCEYEALKADLLVPFQKLAADDQDSVRLLTVENCVHLSKIFKPEDNLKHLVPVVYALCKDKSWRVRYMAADHFCSLYKAVGQLEMKDEDLVDCFVHLLQDNEAEVRTAASNKVTEVALLVGGNVTLNKLIVPCKSLVADSSEYVRAALAKVIMGIASVLGKKDVMDHLLPLFLQLLKDQNPEVRLNIISKLDSVNQVIGLELLSQSLVPAIVQLATDSKWRVRLAIINHIPLLAAQLGADFFEEKLNDLCMHWLGDQVYSIREAATLNLTKIAKVFGAQWSRVNILPKLVTLSSNTSYLFRMTSLNTIADLAPILGAELTTQGLLPVVVRMAGDAVPNVRFNVAKTLQAMLPHIPAKVLDSTVRPCLQKLASDKDVDVQYFATVALKAMQDVIANASH